MVVERIKKTAKDHRRLAVEAVLFLIPVLVLSKLAEEVLRRDQMWLDHKILDWISTTSSTLLDGFFYAITNIFSPYPIIIMTVVISAVLLLRKKIKPAAVLLLSVGVSSIANVILKEILQRDRPALWPSIVHETGYSFPSGHAMASSALFFALIAISWNTKWRWPVLVFSVTITFLVGYSRLYFGVHFPTDIIAGWLVSFVWILIVCLRLNVFPKKNK